MSQNSRMLIGAGIAAVLAMAVYYGVINQQQANNIQGQANQTLGTRPPSQQPASAPSQNDTRQPATPTAPATQTTAPTPR